jgi:chlorophyllide a oxygenase
MYVHRGTPSVAARGQAGPQHLPGCPSTHPSRQCRRLAAASSGEHEACSPAPTPPPPALASDPEAPLRRYGSFFGKNFQLPSWLDEAPRVRVRTIAQRQVNDLVELAVLNERLSGETEPWEARNRLELLRKKRRNWEHIYNYVTKADAALTLELIEEANQQVSVLARSSVGAAAAATPRAGVELGHTCRAGQGVHRRVTHALVVATHAPCLQHP